MTSPADQAATHQSDTLVPARVVLGSRLIPRKAERILDLQPGQGLVGRLLNHTRHLKIAGFGDPAAALEGYQPLLAGRLTDESWPVAPASLDVVVALGVLDEVEDPERLLAQIKPLLKPSGCLVASVGNARSQAALQSLLLAGRSHTSEARARFTLRDLSEILAKASFWFEGPVYAPQAELTPLAAALGDVIARQQETIREQLDGELGATEHVFCAVPHAQPSGRFMLVRVPSFGVTFAEALKEIEPS